MPFKECRHCSTPFVAQANAQYCTATCRAAAWQARQRQGIEGKGQVPAGSVHLWARPGFSDWSEPSSRELIVSPGDVERIDQLPKGKLATRSRPVTRVPTAFVEVLDLLSRDRVRVRAAQCGQGPCACALQAWPADGPEPRPDPFDWFELYLDDDDEAG